MLFCYTKSGDVKSPLFFLLNFYVKTVLTAGADNCVLALLSRKAKVVFAGRTFFVHVGFSVTDLALGEIEECLRLFDKLDKFFVFLLSFVNIS